MAQALSLRGRRGAAQLWLRRAVQTALNAGARALQDFNHVGQKTPLSLQFDATLRPSDYVNGGAGDPLFEEHGLPFVLSGDALAWVGSGDIGVDHAEARLSAGWQTNTPVAGLDLGGSVSLRAADCAALPYPAAGGVICAGPPG